MPTVNILETHQPCEQSHLGKGRLRGASCTVRNARQKNIDFSYVSADKKKEILAQRDVEEKMRREVEAARHREKIRASSIEPKSKHQYSPVKNQEITDEDFDKEWLLLTDLSMRRFSRMELDFFEN